MGDEKKDKRDGHDEPKDPKPQTPSPADPQPQDDPGVPDGPGK